MLWSNINGDIFDVVAKKTNHRQRFALANEALRILAKYPKAPDEEDPRIFPTISNQKYNSHLKEVGKLAGMTGDWITEKQSGRTKTREVRPKYELLTSHVARRTFVTMCLRKGMSPEDIRAVTGHTTADMIMKYVKFDDESKRIRKGADFRIWNLSQIQYRKPANAAIIK
jgi:integrase